MAWEKRGNGSYFYRKERINGRVRSRYTGGGELAVLIEECRKGRRLERIFEAVAEEKRRKKSERIDERLDKLSETNRNLVDALFLINGFHQHKRQWRRKRNGKTDESKKGKNI